MNIDKSYLARWPKIRPMLPPENQKVYEKEYHTNREGASFFSKISTGMEKWMHRKVAAHSGGKILELGAGTLNHLNFERDYECYDIVEPFNNLFENSEQLDHIRNIYKDINEIKPDQLYNRIISIAVLEHLIDLPAVIRAALRLLEPNGVFQAGIPAEGGFIWGLSWRCTTGISYRMRTGANYKYLMRYEHVNNAIEIENILRYYFNSVKIERFVLPWRQVAFYEYIEARNPKSMVL